MKASPSITSNLILMVTAAIWGLAFVAQRVGAQYLGAFTFNGLRFGLGALSLLPVIWLTARKRSQDRQGAEGGWPLIPGLIAGGVLFGGGFIATNRYGRYDGRKSGFYYGVIYCTGSYIRAVVEL